jgi:ammonia channel protein AmtB
LGAASENNTEYVSNEWPSYYASFIGFFLGYLGALPYIYTKELAASPARNISTTGGLVIGFIVLMMSVVFRLSSGCDDILGVVAGVAIGGIMGFTLVNAIAYGSNRSLTNVLALPLLTGTASSGKPIYVCGPSRAGD